LFVGGKAVVALADIDIKYGDTARPEVFRAFAVGGLMGLMEQKYTNLTIDAFRLTIVD
jgi:hypothetical protein